MPDRDALRPMSTFRFLQTSPTTVQKGKRPIFIERQRKLPGSKRDLSNVYEGFWAEFINNPPDEEGNDEPANQPKPSASFFGSVWRVATGFFDVGPKKLSDQGCGGRLEHGFFPGVIFAHQYGLVTEFPENRHEKSLRNFAEAIGAKI